MKHYREVSMATGKKLCTFMNVEQKIDERKDKSMR